MRLYGRNTDVVSSYPVRVLEKDADFIEEIVEAKMNQAPSIPAGLSEKTLLKPVEVCTIFRISKPTLYEWMKQGRLKSFTIRSRRYFARTDIEAIIQRQQKYSSVSKG